VRYFAIIFYVLCGSVHADCWTDTESRYHVSRYLLFAIAGHESRLNTRAINKNTNGTYDIGLMQINSAWLPKLKPYGIGVTELKNACLNLNIGAWILANDFAKYGNNWRAVGAYNAKTEWKRTQYAQRISDKYAVILQRYDPH
jgi:soluble lytic murein transglycosylase-like protein